jgi:cardiolipin synthase
VSGANRINGLDILLSYINWTVVGLGVAISLFAAIHVLLHHRKPQATFTWVAVCLMWPLVGAILYFMFGNNRVVTRAKRLHGSVEVPTVIHSTSAIVPDSYRSLGQLSQTVTGKELTEYNSITPLFNAEQVYPAMLEAINNATRSIYLLSYIFDYKGSGIDFVEALAAAKNKGVEVKVLIDGVGEKYSWPTARSRLTHLGVDTASYFPPKLIPPTFTLNLRNHRKLLIVDDKVAFTGGMNIRAAYLGEKGKQSDVRDIHFKLVGDVIAQLRTTFVADWNFSSEIFIPEKQGLAADFTNQGNVLCRVIEAGPNEDIDKLVRILIGAISAAKHRISIMTPYFLPPRELEVVLQTAVLRGVKVDVLMPANNNLPIVKWAANHAMLDMLKIGVNCYFQPGAFVHSKLFVVDDAYVQIGSANLDPRSLRLNFELMIEVYDPAFASTMLKHFDQSMMNAQPISYRDIAGRNVLYRLRDALAWLLSPFL